MPITLTLEQKKDIARRMEEGYRFGREMQAQEAGRLMQGTDLESVADNGLVIQQRRFAKIREAQRAANRV